MKLKVQITTNAGQVLTKTVEVLRLDVKVAVNRAALALGLDMQDVREAIIVTD